MSDIMDRLLDATDRDAVSDAQEEIAALRAEVERLKIENIQMQAALGYGILADDERHILPSNPFKCGTCDASKHLRADNERLRAALEPFANLTIKGDEPDVWAKEFPRFFKLITVARAALEASDD